MHLCRVTKITTDHMDFNNIKIEALKRAKQNEICEEWAVKMENAQTLDELLDMYIKGIDFSFSSEFISCNGSMSDNIQFLNPSRPEVKIYFLFSVIMV